MTKSHRPDNTKMAI